MGEERPKETAPPIFTAALKDGLRSARYNLKPGLVIQGVAVTIAVLYYLVPEVAAFFSGVADTKSRYGLLFSSISTAVFGGIVPFVIAEFRKSRFTRTDWRDLVFFTLFWAYRGIEIDLLYRLQGIMFGTGAAASTVAAKVLFDQFVYNVVLAGPLQYLAYTWKNSGYSRTAFSGLTPRTMLPHVLSILVSTWGVWIPLTAVIYAMPSDLQVPFFNLVLCFWVLLLTTLTENQKRTTESL